MQPLASNGGTPVRSRPWPSWPVYGDAERRSLIEVLESNVWGVNGKKVPELECNYAGLHDAKHAVACCNGTVAIQIALVAAGIQPGDEVITTPYTFMATALAALNVGAVPVFVDVEPGTHNIDPELIEQAIGEKTTAILPVHIGGRPADMDRLQEIADKHSLTIVEDAAQAWMASWKETPVGALGRAGTFSFQSSKNLTGGEGGIVLTNDEETFVKAWSLHNCGRTPGGEWYEHKHPGVNYRMTEFQAALILDGLERLPEQQRARTAAMQALSSGLAAVEGIEVPAEDTRVTGHGCHIFMARLSDDRPELDKMAIVRALQAEGIPAHPGYTVPLNKQSFWDWFADRPTESGGRWGDLWRQKPQDAQIPVCERLCASTIWIKQDVLLAGAEEMADVIEAFEKVMAHARAGSLPRAAPV